MRLYFKGVSKLTIIKLCISNRLHLKPINEILKNTDIQAQALFLIIWYILTTLQLSKEKIGFLIGFLANLGFDMIGTRLIFRT